jgi:hypothetical protein
LDEGDVKGRITNEILDQSNLISSVPNDGESNRHLPIFDFDFPIATAPSSTKGCHHLYLGVVITWPQYTKILLAFEEAGLLDERWVKETIKRGEAHLRLPNIKKTKKSKSSGRVSWRMVDDNVSMPPDQLNRLLDQYATSLRMRIESGDIADLAHTPSVQTGPSYRLQRSQPPTPGD